FFFSSRRRHTRFSRDWSSDVCSSDLGRGGRLRRRLAGIAGLRQAAVRIEVVEGDITVLAVDAIINAANESLLGGGGVDGAIHRAAGSGLLDECRKLPEVRPGVRCPTGEARITGGHRLPARFVIHTVGPVWQGGGAGEPALLAACYTNALRLAEEHGLSSIAFP